LRLPEGRRQKQEMYALTTQDLIDLQRHLVSSIVQAIRIDLSDMREGLRKDLRRYVQEAFLTHREDRPSYYSPLRTQGVNVNDHWGSIAPPRLLEVPLPGAAPPHVLAVSRPTTADDDYPKPRGSKAWSKEKTHGKENVESDEGSVDEIKLQHEAPPSTVVKKLQRGRTVAPQKWIQGSRTDDHKKNAATLNGWQLKGWRLKVQTLLQSNVFESAVSAILVFNAVTIGLQADHFSRTHNRKPTLEFRIVELIFCVIFTVELFLRFVAYGCKIFCMRGWQWNVYDMTLVIAQLVDESVGQFAPADDFSHTDATSDFMRLARILRLLRIVRITRLIRFLPELRKLLYLILASFWSFLWTAILLAAVIYILGVCITHTVAEYGPVQQQGQTIITEWEELYEYFGNLQSSCFSLYMAVTGGIDWNDLSSPLQEIVSPVLGLAIVLYVGFTSLVVLNLVTGLFVDGAMRLSSHDKQKEFLAKMVKALGGIDCTITKERFLDIAFQPELSHFWDALELHPHMASEVFSFLDRDGTGWISVSEFAQGAVGLQEPAKVVDITMLVHELTKIVQSESFELLGLVKERSPMRTYRMAGTSDMEV